MTLLETLEQELHDHDVPVVCVKPPRGLKGLYWDNRKSHLIVLSPEMETNAERLSVLAEEAGHYYTSAGNILYLRRDNVLNRQQERRARAWAYKRLVPPEGIISAWLRYIRTPWEFAEYFGVTEAFFRAAIAYYKQKHELVWHVGQYVITFEPFDILEKKKDLPIFVESIQKRHNGEGI